MPVEFVYQGKFDRSVSPPEIGLLEFHTKFSQSRGRVLEFISQQEEISVSLEVFSQKAKEREDSSDTEIAEISDHQKYVDWLNLHARGKVKIVSNKIPKKSGKIPSAVWALTGGNKTSRMSGIREKFPDACMREISAHNLIRGELGETQRRLQAAFVGNAVNKFPIVLWDDIDLTLGTEGRIIKEIISDLTRILENFQGLFVFSAETAEAVPAELQSRVTEWNPEISIK
jgi:hypothetical protein